MKKLFTLLTLLLCAVSGAWAEEICSAQIPNSDPWVGTNTEGIAQTGCTLMWSGVQAGSNIVTVSGVDYFKLGGDAAYVQLALTSGNFQAGDVLKATVTSNGSNKVVNIKVKDNYSETVKVSSTETKVIEYTLQSEDIEDDGSIKIYRGNSGGSNLRVAIFSVSRATDTYTVTFDAGSYGTCATTSLTEESVGAGVTLPAVTPNSGYAFNGWYTAASEGTKIGDAGDTYNPTANITLYAQYAPAINRIGFNTYYVAEGDEVVSGTQVVCDDITMLYDNVTYNTAIADNMINSINANYVASVSCGTNGWGVTFTPSSDGTLSVGVVINGTKTFSISNATSFDYNGIDEDSNASAGTNASGSWTPAKKQYTIITLPVTSGTSYKFSVAGSKMSLYGFEFAPTGATVTASFAAGKEYITFASEYALDCTTANLPAGLKAYKATGASASSVTIEEVDATVAAGTGLLLQRTGDTSAAGNFDIPVVASGTNISATNKLVGVTAAAGAAIGGDGVYDYVLKDGKFYHASAGTLAQGKAYLHLDAEPAAPVLTIDFSGTTGINAVNGSEIKANGEYYNLNGQRVANPTKGLYIVNGKKVVLK